MAAEHRGAGRSQWYQVTDEISVCGAYEVSFCVWLMECGLTFTAHPEPLTWYDDDGTERLYYPDFWVETFKTYVDVKARHWANIQAEKLAKIQAQHPNVMILTEDDFEYLKIPLLRPKRDEPTPVVKKPEPYCGRIGISVGYKPTTKKKKEK